VVTQLVDQLAHVLAATGFSPAVGSPRNSVSGSLRSGHPLWPGTATMRFSPRARPGACSRVRRKGSVRRRRSRFAGTQRSGG
jgi:hypothetical protein